MPDIRGKRRVTSALGPANRRVCALIYDRMAMFEFGIVTEMFALPRPELGVPWYRFSVCALGAGSLAGTGGVRVTGAGGLEQLARAGTIVIPGWRDPAARPPEALLAALRRAHKRGARILSICSGVFVLAAAGLLDGHRATTHWRYVERLRSAFPAIRVEPDALYVDEGSILTSAGSAAGIDLCLHLIRRDYGAQIANQVARRLVVSPHREGGQAQFIREPVAALTAHGDGGMSVVMEWALRRLSQPLRVQDLARQAHMSPRTFARRFVDETGSTPHRWLTVQRLDAAQRRLETKRESIDETAAACGFESAMTLRHHFRRAFHTTPTAYRRRFAT